jgi:hypothetical protein
VSDFLLACKEEKAREFATYLFTALFEEFNDTFSRQEVPFFCQHLCLLSTCHQHSDIHIGKVSWQGDVDFEIVSFPYNSGFQAGCCSSIVAYHIYLDPVW